MAKPSEPSPSAPLGAGPITPGPEITIDAETPPPDIDEVEMMDATPPPGVIIERPARTGDSGPSPAAQARWAAQPTQPMGDEATVPLPMEEVEFADGESELTGPATPPPITPTPRPAAPPAPRPPAMTPAAEQSRPAPAETAVDGGAGVRVPVEVRATPPVRPPALAGGGARPAAPTPPSGAPLLPPGATWSEALSQRPRKKRLKPWFEEVFDEDYLRTLPFMTAEQTLREVAFIRDSLHPPADGEILDVGCGYGRHAIELGQGGLRVTGVDLSLPLLIRAADESQRRSLSVNFVHADMREMAFDSQFDGAFSFLTSFGYFDEETNLKVLSSICRSLRPGGRFLLDALNRDHIVSDLPTRVWWEGDGCVVLEEVDFNFQTSRLLVRRSIVFQDGRQIEHDISIRAYSLHEIAKLVRQAGFRVVEISGGIATRGHYFGSTSRSILMLCERPTE